MNSQYDIPWTKQVLKFWRYKFCYLKELLAIWSYEWASTLCKSVLFVCWFGRRKQEFNLITSIISYRNKSTYDTDNCLFWTWSPETGNIVKPVLTDWLGRGYFPIEINRIRTSLGTQRQLALQIIISYKPHCYTARIPWTALSHVPLMHC